MNNSSLVLQDYTLLAMPTQFALDAAMRRFSNEWLDALLTAAHKWTDRGKKHKRIPLASLATANLRELALRFAPSATRRVETVRFSVKKKANQLMEICHANLIRSL